MNAESFYHVSRSAAAIAGVRDVTVFGAAAVVPWVAELRPSASFWPSMELDVDPGRQDLADLVDGSIGEGSLFAETFGVFAHGVSLECFVAPGDWRSRARVFVDPVAGVRVLAPHPVDLAAAKLLRGDAKDWEFARYCVEELGVPASDVSRGLMSIAETMTAVAGAARAALAALPSRLARPKA